MQDHSRYSRLSIEQGRTAQYKSWSSFIFLVVGLLINLATAISAHVKEDKDEKARRISQELSVTVKELAENQKKQAKDIKNLHNYLQKQNNQPILLIEKDDRNMAESFSDILRKRKTGKQPKEMLIKKTDSTDLPKLESEEKDLNIPEFK